MQKVLYIIIYANPITENVEMLPNVLYYDGVEFDTNVNGSSERYGGRDVYGRTS